MNEYGRSHIEAIIENTIVVGGLSLICYIGIYRLKWFTWSHVGYFALGLIGILIPIIGIGLYLLNKDKNHKD